jgi:hypothetical protein
MTTKLPTIMEDLTINETRVIEQSKDGLVTTRHKVEIKEPKHSRLASSLAIHSPAKNQTLSVL